MKNLVMWALALITFMTIGGLAQITPERQIPVGGNDAETNRPTSNLGTTEVRPSEVITTTITLRSWKTFKREIRDEFEPNTPSDIRELNVGGFPAISSRATINDVPQKVIALNLGYRTLILASNDLTRSTEEMMVIASEWIEEALNAPLAAAENIACNCVLWARSQTTSLPTGMTTYSEKVSKINQLFPTVATNPNSSVAIIRVPSGSSSQYGHVAVNRSVEVQSDGSLKIKIQEANWTSCTIGYRTGTLEALNVTGFFDPRYTSGSAHPKITSPTSTTGTAGRQFVISVNGSGFESNSMKAVILGGSCTTFDRCQVPTSVITNRTSTTAKIPVTLGRGTYRLYIFNSSSGKTSNGITVTAN